jgi:SAM-dependent methyltransferase
MKNILRRISFALKYLGDPPWDTGETPPEIIDHITDREPGQALDIGCGTGTNVIYLAQRGWKVIGIDFIPRAIRTARSKAKGLDLPVEFQVQDVTNPFELDKMFDFIYDIGCFHSLSYGQRGNYLDNILRHLKPDGFFMLYGWLAESTDDQRGIRKNDIENFSGELNIIDRTDSTERGRWASIWMKFQRGTNE